MNRYRDSYIIAFIIGCIALLACAACDDEGNIDPEKVKAAAAVKIWNGPCADVSILLATTAGSPSEMTCPNKHHHMHVEIASKPSNEEFGALVFCECERAADSAADAGAK